VACFLVGVQGDWPSPPARIHPRLLLARRSRRTRIGVHHRPVVTISKACSHDDPDDGTSRGAVTSLTPSTACGDVSARKSMISPRVASAAQIRLHSALSAAKLSALMVASISSRRRWSRAFLSCAKGLRCLPCAQKRTSGMAFSTSAWCAKIRRDAPPARTGDLWFGQRQAAEALSSGSISDLVENGFVR
jgi:hypothetical protein